MRKVLGFVVMSAVLGLLAPGCAVGTSGDPSSGTPGTQDHGFQRGTAGEAKPVDPATVNNFTPAHGFDHTVSSEGQQSLLDPDPDSVSCSGACNANVCVCSGDLDCCIAGCLLCWEVLDQT